MPTSTPPPGDPSGPASSGATQADFDAFYLRSRRRLVLQAYALTGDLSAARVAVSDAFVAARQHWRKVSRLPDPEEWVRPRAWAMAQRRHVARLWRREKGLSAEQKAVLDALHHLPDQQRKVLLLTHLAGMSAAGTGRELGETPARIERQLATAARSFRKRASLPVAGPGREGAAAERAERRTGAMAERGPDAEVLAAIESLAPIAEAAALPHPETILRGGRRRARLHTAVGVVAMVVLTLAGGLFVERGGFVAPVAAEQRARQQTRQQTRATPVTADMLLSLAQVQSLAPSASWQLLATSDNTDGTGINTVCQTTRFADPRGRKTFIRTFLAPGTVRRHYLQTVEISRSARAAEAAYMTTLGWFAGCQEARLQLLNAYRLRGLGDQAQLLKLRVPGHVRRTYVVGLARSGSLTVSTVLETLNGRPVEITRAVKTLTDAVRDLCSADASGACPVSVSASPVLPPRSGETPGTLAVADLPVVGRVNRPWVGTSPAPAQPNLAATTCDKADFVKAGAPDAATRTFLIPEAKLAMRFGITETYGTFPSTARAAALFRSISAAMGSCAKRDLGAKVSNTLMAQGGYRGSEFALWRLDSEINPTTTVGFWMGVARVGRYVAQVNFTPTGDLDIDEVTFQALIARARDRLFELSGPTP